MVYHLENNFYYNPEYLNYNNNKLDSNLIKTSENNQGFPSLKNSRFK